MSNNRPAYFFSATQSVDNRLGDVFSFIWASYAGLRELWWQVRGFKKTFPETHINEIKTKFLSGLPLPGGIDLQRVCIGTEWEEHEGEFAKWLLFEACTLYEGWLEKICRDIFPSSSWENYVKKLQFPHSINKRSKPDGYVVAISAANAVRSPLMATEFFPNVSRARLNCWSTLDPHLTSYRYFKECRNAYIHSNGTATTDVMDWHSKLDVIQNSVNPFPFRHRFRIPTPNLGTPIPLDLKDCILFATVVRRLICTFDAALCVSAKSEKLLEERLRSLIARNPKWKNLPHDPAKRLQRLHRMLVASRVPEPVNFANVVAWMKSKKLV